MSGVIEEIEEQILYARREKSQRNLNTAKRRIWVTFQKEGLHCYPDALVNPDLAEVSFLGHPHRHIFHFRIAIEVTHNDRDIEFILFKRWCESLYSGTLILDHKSCEMISDDLYAQISMKYSDRDVIIEVSEDGENGCQIEYLNTRSQTFKFN